MKYDVIVIGGGPGGYVAAIRAAQLGRRVALIEKERVGGVCLNRGCIPTKALLKTSGLYQSILNAKEFGISTGPVSVDYAAAISRKDALVQRLTQGVEALLRANGVSMIYGDGRLASPNSVKVNGESFACENVILATGSRAVKLPVPGAQHALESDAFLSMKELPKSVVIIGGGVIGVEFAVLMAELGVGVTIVEMLEHVLAMADADVIAAVEQLLVQKAVKLVLGARVTNISASGIVAYERGGAKGEAHGEKVVLAAGRAPNSDTSMLNALGIAHDKGAIKTDEYMRTSVSGVFAVGDVNGKSMLAHTASAEGLVAAANCAGQAMRMGDYSAIPSCVYLHPEAAWVGLTEKEANDRGRELRIGKFPMAANGRALAEGEGQGFVKIIADVKYDEVIGVHMVCHGAAELIGEAVLGMSLEATLADFAGSVHPHPTRSEALGEAAHGALGQMINYFGRL